MSVVNVDALMEALDELIKVIEENNNCPICFGYEEFGKHSDHCNLNDLHNRYNEIKER